jgi:hypothetical protein
MSYNHPEKVVTGSLWKLKGPLAAYFLFDAAHNSWVSYDPECYEYIIIEDQILMLVKHEIKNGRHNFWLLARTCFEKCEIIRDLSIPVGTWDNVFVPVINKKTKV